MMPNTKYREILTPIVRWVSIDVVELHITLAADAACMLIGDQELSSQRGWNSDSMVLFAYQSILHKRPTL